MKTTTVLLHKDDFPKLEACLKGSAPSGQKEVHLSRSLSEELAEATVLDDDSFPADVIRLNSLVVIEDVKTKKEMTFILVLPSEANIKEKKVSILAPIGTAVIGFREGQRVSWQVPAGVTEFLIKKVSQTSETPS